MLVVLRLVLTLVLFAFLMLVVMVGLHAFHNLFLFRLVSQSLQKVDDLHVRVDGLLQGIVHPAVGLAAHIEEHVAGGNLHNILGCRLIAVQIHAGIQQHGELRVGYFLTENLPDPVIFRENGGDDLQFLFFAVFSRFFRRILRGFRSLLRRSLCSGRGRCLSGTSAGAEGDSKSCTHQNRYIFFHDKLPPNDYFMLIF